MKQCYILVFLAAVAGWQRPGFAALQLVPDPTIQRVFASSPCPARAVFQNSDDANFEADLFARLFQASSATVIPLDVTAWKRLKVLGGQTVVETAAFEFPPVKAETLFLVQWLEGTNRIIGTTEITVYPTNLLADLPAVAGGEAVGLLDPENELKPLFRKLDLKFVDLENAGFRLFSGKLAVVGPFKSHENAAKGLTERVESFARKGGAVVWIQPPMTSPGRKLKPTYYTIPVGEGAVVVAQAQLISDLANNPLAQLNLIQLARAAACPEPLWLPGQNDN